MTANNDHMTSLEGIEYRTITSPAGESPDLMKEGWKLILSREYKGQAFNVYERFWGRDICLRDARIIDSESGEDLGFIAKDDDQEEIYTAVVCLRAKTNHEARGGSPEEAALAALNKANSYCSWRYQTS